MSDELAAISSQLSAFRIAQQGVIGAASAEVELLVLLTTC
jgi:hypothetical protein